MYTDVRGLELSTSRAEAAEALAAVGDRLAGFRTDLADRVKAAVTADPDWAYAHVLRGYLMLLVGQSALAPVAQKSLDAATPTLPDATERERAHADVLRLWLAGDLTTATRRLEAIVERWPLDLLALRIAHLFQFWQGDAPRLRDTVERTLPHWSADTPGQGYLLGMHAFGLEECGRYAEAEQAGRSGVACNPEDYWSTHAVAHVMEMEGRHRDGIEWLDGLAEHWGGGNDFINHLWWHRALYPLELGRLDAVLEIYDTYIRTGRLDFYLVMHNAASLLWRLELCGADVGDRWTELARHAAERAQDHANPFHDMHYAMALSAAAAEGDVEARAAQEAHLESLRTGAVSRPGSWAPVFSEVTVPLCEALGAFREGREADALAGIEQVWAQLHRAGGSHAQRDVIAQTAVTAALRCGRFDRARALLAARTAAKPRSAWSWNCYAEVLAAQDETEAATAARARAEALENPG